MHTEETRHELINIAKDRWTGSGGCTAHTAQVLDEQLEVVCKRRVIQIVAGFAALEQAALADAAPGTRLEVVIEPTGGGVAAGRGLVHPPRP